MDAARAARLHREAVGEQKAAAPKLVDSVAEIRAADGRTFQTADGGQTWSQP